MTQGELFKKPKKITNTELVLEALQETGKPMAEHEIQGNMQQEGTYMSGSSISALCRKLRQKGLIWSRTREKTNYTEYCYGSKP